MSEMDEIKWCLGDGGAGPCRNESMIEDLRAECERLRRELAAAQAREQEMSERMGDALSIAEQALVAMEDTDFDEKLRGVFDERVEKLEAFYRTAEPSRAALDGLLAEARREGAECIAEKAAYMVKALIKAWSTDKPDGVVRMELVRLQDAIRALPLEPADD